MDFLWIKKRVMETNVYECTGCLPVVVNYKNYLLLYYKMVKKKKKVSSLNLKVNKPRHYILLARKMNILTHNSKNKLRVSLCKKLVDNLIWMRKRSALRNVSTT